MKKNIVIPISLLLAISTFSSCETIANIFGAGFKLGIIVAVVVVIAVIYLVVKMFGGK